MDDQERNHEALIDRIAEQARIIRHRNDRITEVEARANELALELAHAATRADKAEKERDEWKDSAIKAVADLERAEQPRPVYGYNFVATGGHVYQNVDDIKPLTADDITDEMIERARNAPSFDGRLSPTPRLVREMLTAALTEPPRPLTADDITDEMIERARNAPSFDGRLSPTPRLVREMLTAALTEPPRPLTADDITDEARERAYRAVAALSVSDWDDLSDVARGRAMAIVEAVITEVTRPEPPARPEGAEKVEAVLHRYWSGDINGDDLADRIVEEMNR